MGLNPVFASHVKINRRRIMQGSWQRPLVRLQGLFWWRNDLAIYLGGVGRSDIPPSVGLGESVSKQALMGTEKSMPGKACRDCTTACLSLMYNSIQPHTGNS